MAYRKNVKRIDPRYFLHETVGRGSWPSSDKEAANFDQETRITAIQGAAQEVQKIAIAAQKEAQNWGKDLKSIWPELIDLFEDLKYGMHPADGGWFRLSETFPAAIDSADRAGMKISAAKIAKQHFKRAWEQLQSAVSGQPAG
jgi:hypothetical protein